MPAPLQSNSRRCRALLLSLAWIAGCAAGAGAPPDPAQDEEDAAPRPAERPAPADGPASTPVDGPRVDGPREPISFDTAGTVSDGMSATVPDAGPAADRSADAPSLSQSAFGASRCEGSGLLFCEDFESGAISSTRWGITQLNTPLIDSVHVARGTKAWHIVDSARAFIYPKGIFPIARNTYYARIFVYFDALPTVNAVSHWNLAYATNVRYGVGTPEARIDGGRGRLGSPHGFGVGSCCTSGDWGMYTKDQPRFVPEKKWICLEWMHKGDTNETRVWWDDVEHPSLYLNDAVAAKMAETTGKPPFAIPQINYVNFGFVDFRAAGEKHNIWIDEIAIDSKRIGCQR